VPRKRTPKPIVLNVGITGHRATVINGALLDILQPVVDEVFGALRDATLQIQESEVVFCSATPAQLRLHTALASGADQIASKSARSSGYYVRALLPFEPNEYRKDFTFGEELDEFDRELDAADEIVALPGERTDLEAAYVLVGESLVEEADVLIAIWDGQEGNGPGGTAHVVELALEKSVPVIHIEIDRSAEQVGKRALTGGKALEPVAVSLLASDHYCGLLRGALKARVQPTRKPASKRKRAAKETA
jgi:hypothetical protein